MDIPLDQQEKALLCQLETLNQHRDDIIKHIQRVEAELGVVYAQKHLEKFKGKTK